VKYKGSLRRFPSFVHYQRRKVSLSFFPRKIFVSPFSGNRAKNMLFLSLYFKALKYTFKGYEKIEEVEDIKNRLLKVRAIIGSSTVSVEIPSFLVC
jgi:hypothetical protein